MTAFTARLSTSTILTSAIAAMTMAAPAWADGITGGNAVVGSASIDHFGKHTEITSHSTNTLMDFRTFNVNTDESANVAQQSAGSKFMARVVGGLGASNIDGKLTSNGNVFIVNSQGVLFGAGAQVNVGGLVASTADISNDDFRNGNLNLNKAGVNTASVENHGNINVAEGGMAVFVAPTVKNTGVVTAKLGKVAMVSGETFTMDMYGDGLLSVQASDSLNKQLVQNSGEIQANGGTVVLTAAAAQNAVESVINMDGLIEASSATSKGGKVVLSGAKETRVSGTINAKGATTGGKVDVLGKNVAVLSGGKVDVSGTNGGGKIRVGGDFHGNGDVANAENTVVQSDAALLANAIEYGNGGDVAVWADNNTFFYGDIEAKGGANGGNGGFVETSGKIYLDAFGDVDASAVNGTGGEWLLDPNNITITASPDSDNQVTGGPNYTTTNNNARVGVSNILSSLNNGISVTITTASAGGNSQPGNITVESSIGKTGTTDSSLTLNAHNNITVNSGVTISSTLSKLNVSLLADSDGTNGGSINMAGTINSNGGNVTLAGGVSGAGYASGSTTAGTAYGVLIGGSINAAGGDITVRGQGRQTNSNDNYGVVFQNGTPTLQTNGGGNITITGIGGGNTAGNTRNHGIYSINANTTLSTVNGNISLTGTGGATAGGTDSNGIQFENGTVSFTSSGSGNVSFTGTGGGNSGTSDNNYGLHFYNNNATITSNSGNVSLTGTGGGTNASDSDSNHGIRTENGSRTISSTSGTTTINGTAGGDKGDNNYGFFALNSTNTIGNAASTGNVNFVLDRISLTNGSFTAKTLANVDLKGQNNTSIGIAGGAGGLQLTNTILNGVTAGSISVTSQGAGGLITANARTWQAPVSFISDLGDMYIDGMQTMGARTFTVNTGGNLSIRNTGGVNSSATGDAIVLNAKNFFNTTAGNPLTASAGRWLIYSTKPENNTLGTMTSDFFRYSCTYAGACPTFPASGNGFLYSFTPVVTVTLTPEAKTTTYGLAAPTLTYTFSGYNGGDEGTDIRTGSATLSTPYTAGMNVGSYDITVDAGTLTSSLGYSFVGSTLTNGLTVNKAEITVNTAGVNAVYGAGFMLNSTISGYQMGGVYSDQLTSVSVSHNGTSSTGGHVNVGTWDLTVTPGSYNAANYNITYNTGSLVITPKAITVSALTSDKVYDGNRDATVTLSNNALTGDVVTQTYTTARFGDEDVGERNATVNGIAISGDDAGNYTLTSNTASDRAFITARDLTIFLNDQTAEYADGSSLGNGFTDSGDLQNGETLSSITYTSDAELSTSLNRKVGTWSLDGASATGANGFEVSNYNITYASGVLTVTPKDITVSVLTSDKVYDGNRNATVTLSNDAVSGDVVTHTYTTARFGDEDVGNRNATVSGIALTGADGGNYSLTSTTASDRAFITARDLTLTINDQTTTYGDGAAIGDGWTDSGDLQNGETITGLTYSSDTGFSTGGHRKAGTFDLVGASATGANGFEATNYNITYIDGELTINKRDLAITSARVNDKTYDGTNVATNLIFLGHNPATGDTGLAYHHSGATFDTKDVGTDKIVTVNGLNLMGVDSANYNLDTNLTTLADINARALTLTLNDQTAEYADGSSLGAGFTDSGDLQNGETVTDLTYTSDAELSTSLNRKVGTWSLDGADAVGDNGFVASNYDITYASGILTVTPKDITVSVLTADKVYDGNRNASVTLSNDAVSGDVVTHTYTSARFGDEDVGNRNATVNGIALTGADAGNYTLTSNRASDRAFITARALTLTLNDQNAIYADGSALGSGWIDSGDLQNGETISGITYSSDAELSTSLNRKAGTWSLDGASATGANGFEASNYNITYVSGILTIDQKLLNITATAFDKTYDANIDASVDTLTNDAVTGDIVTNGHLTAEFDTKDVGTDKTVTIGGLNIAGDDASNYYLASTDTTTLADITKRDLNIKARNQTTIYGLGNLLFMGYTTSGLQGGETVGNVTLSTNAESSTSGNWKATNGTPWTINTANATGGSFDINNYNVNYQTGNLTINRLALLATADANNKTYDATNIATVTMGDTRISGDVFTTGYTTARFNNKNVGNNKLVTVSGISISGADASNYNLLNTTTVDLANITRASLTIDANDKSMTYGDGNTFNGFTATGLQGGETVGSVTLTTDATKSTSLNWNVSDPSTPWVITASGATGGTFSTSNYAITYTTGSLEIGQKSLNVTATATDKSYDASTTASVTLSDDRIINDVFDTAYGAANFDTKDVGSPKLVTVNGINISGTDAANYTNNTSTTTSASITKADLTITANDQSQTYGDGNDLTEGFTAVGLQGGETVGRVRLTTDATRSSSDNWEAGDWSITASNARNGTFDINNYAVTYNTGDLAIAKKDITVAMIAQDKTYDGDRLATFTLSNDAISGDTVRNNSGQARFDDKNAGTDKLVTVNNISISGRDASNYNLTNTSATDLADIFRRLLTVSIIADDKVYDGDRVATVTLSDDRVAGDRLNESYDRARFDTRHVGDDKLVTVTGIDVTGRDVDNYTFNTTATDLANITPASLTITAVDVGMTYGDGNAFNGVTTSGLITGEDIGGVDITTDATLTGQHWNAGTFSITADNVQDNGRFRASNYDIQYVDGTLVVTPRTLTVVADDMSKTYGDADPSFTFTATNYASGEDESVFSGAQTRDVGENVADGPYTIYQGSLTAGGNYAIDYTGALFNIDPATLRVIADDQFMSMGGSLPPLTYGASGFKFSDNAGSVLTGELETVPARSFGGSYAIDQGTLASNTNYVIDYTQGTLYIDSPFGARGEFNTDPDNTSEQTSGFSDANFQTPQSSTLLSSSGGTGGTPTGNLGDLSPAAGGDPSQLGDLSPAAGGDTFAMMQCDENNPCDMPQ